jgi:hypothetical protein
MKDLVIVKSKTINNESVPVVITFIEPSTGEDETREITRSIVFENFQAEMPLKWAKALIEQSEERSPGEYSIIDGKGELSQRAEKAVQVAKEKIQGFKCQFCGAESKSKAGLSAHIRYNHPDKWEGKKTIKTEVKE